MVSNIYNSRLFFAKKLSIILLTLCSSFTLSATSIEIQQQGYIITHDKKEILGKIANLNHSNVGYYLTFVNTAGDTYSIHPVLINGFVFENEFGELVRYESHYQDYKWYFLRVLLSGELSTLLASPNKNVTYNATLRDYLSSKRNQSGYWVFFHKSRQLVHLYPSNFKEPLRKQLSKYPSLKDKIGKKGYRLKNIYDIIKELNENYGGSIRQL